jgi:hypothetical protein
MAAFLLLFFNDYSFGCTALNEHKKPNPEYVDSDAY